MQTDKQLFTPDFNCHRGMSNEVTISRLAIRIILFLVFWDYLFSVIVLIDISQGCGEENHWSES